MNIFFAVIAALAIIALGIALMKYRALRMRYTWLQEDINLEEKAHQKTKRQKAALEKEVGVLRDSNRSATKVWSSERRRLWAQARDAERHASEMQEFHLHNEQDLMHELAGAHALIELLMIAVPKGGVISQTHEVRRIFRPVVEMGQPKPAPKRDINVF